MKAFVTGGTGFIGTRLVRLLAQAGHEARCLIRKSSDASGLREANATLVIGDVTDKASLVAGMKGCDWVLNLANLYSFWESDKRIFTRVNVDGTRNVLETALELGVSKVVHVTSAVVYGKPKDCPFTETSAAGPVHFSEYARTKYAGDLIAWELYEKQGLPLVMIYPGAVLGSGDPKATGHYIEDLVRRHLPATVFPRTVMTFVHVNDAARAILMAAEKSGNIGEKYLVGGHRASMRQLNEMVHEISGVPLPRLSLPSWLTQISAVLMTGLAGLTGKPPLWGMSTDQIATMKEGFAFDGSKAERELGLSYTPIRQAIEETIALYR
jgi:dihydroflavonol-4-reductase